MELHTLTPTVTRRKRRLGLGHGSGRGKTAGRGTKGQHARGKIALSFEGGALPLIKRLPFKRGKEKNKSFKKKPITLNIKVLNLLEGTTTVDIDSLIAAKIVDADQARVYGVKILGDGELTKALTVRLPVSAGAAQKIEKAGGRVEHA